jgi:hypothetical protein
MKPDAVCSGKIRLVGGSDKVILSMNELTEWRFTAYNLQ